MLEPIQAIQRLMDAKEREMLSSSGASEKVPSSQCNNENGNGGSSGALMCDGLLDIPLFQSLQPLSRRNAKIFDYRGEKVGKEICLKAG